MTLTELATNIGSSTEVATQLLETYSIDLAKITAREVESLKTVASPGSITTKTPKKAPAKQLEGDTTSAITSGTTATLTAPEAPTINVSTDSDPLDLDAVRSRFSNLVQNKYLPGEIAAREGMIDGIAVVQQEASITDNFLSDFDVAYRQARLPQ